MIAESYPQLGWLASRPTDAQTAPATITPPITSSNPEELETISLSLAGIRRRVDEFAANQEQIIRDITTNLQVTKQEILDKMSAPSPQLATAPPRTPALPAPRTAPVR
jgi:pyruvate/2-oxoglutarate dehydrogenase complex dihydrolipoamide acyltransferase (E2) component